MHHELKINSPYFEAVIRGEKKFEIRNNLDRGFQKGDTVLLRELQAELIATENYTGREQLIEITYVTNYYQRDNVVVFAFKLIGEVINNTEKASDAKANS